MIMRYLLICILSILLNANNAQAQQQRIADLPTTIIPAKIEKGETMVLIISGDAGWSTFCTRLAQEYTLAGIPIVGLSSLKYFWNKKTAEQTASDVAALLNEYSVKWKMKQILLVGYSFGADVMPFIYNRLPKNLKEKTKALILLSPSKETDFEIHISYLFGSNKMNVANEVMKVDKPMICYYGTEEKEKPLMNLKMKNFKLIILNGAHHYENGFSEIVEQSLK